MCGGIVCTVLRFSIIRCVTCQVFRMKTIRSAGVRLSGATREIGSSYQSRERYFKLDLPASRAALVDDKEGSMQ